MRIGSSGKQNSGHRTLLNELREEAWDENRELLFVEKYLANGQNATQTVIDFGLTKDRQIASVWGSEIVRRPRIREALKRVLEENINQARSTKDMVRSELMKIAFGDLADAVEFSGARVRLRDSEKLPAHVRSLIASVSQGQYGISIKGHDKLKALELLAKLDGLIIDKAMLESTGELTVNVKRVDVGAERFEKDETDDDRRTS